MHIDFPIRGVVTCGCCHHPMTSNYSTGRSGKRFPYYVCHHRGCEKFGKSVRREIVEDAFESLLVKFKPSDALFSLFSRLFRKRWDEASAKAKDIKSTLRVQAAAADKKINGLLDRIMTSDKATVIKRYESEIEILERDKLVIAERIAKCGTALPDYDATF